MSEKGAEESPKPSVMNSFMEEMFSAVNTLQNQVKLPINESDTLPADSPRLDKIKECSTPDLPKTTDENTIAGMVERLFSDKEFQKLNLESVIKTITDTLKSQMDSVKLRVWLCEVLLLGQKFNEAKTHLDNIVTGSKVLRQNYSALTSDVQNRIQELVSESNCPSKCSICVKVTNVFDPCLAGVIAIHCSKGCREQICVTCWDKIKKKIGVVDDESMYRRKCLEACSGQISMIKFVTAKYMPSGKHFCVKSKRRVLEIPDAKSNDKTKSDRMTGPKFNPSRDDPIFIGIVRKGMYAMAQNQWFEACKSLDEALDSAHQHRDNMETVLGICAKEMVLLKFQAAIANLKATSASFISKGYKLMNEIVSMYPNPEQFPLAYFRLAEIYIAQTKYKEASTLLRSLANFAKQKSNNLVDLTCSCHYRLLKPFSAEAQMKEISGDYGRLVDLCDNAPNPDAVCIYASCKYEQTSIYKHDPKFNGYVELECGEKCKAQFHISCWRKYRADQGNKKDEQILQTNCLTPDCVGKVLMIVHYDENGEGKSKKIAPEKKKMDEAAEQEKTKKGNKIGKKLMLKESKKMTKKDTEKGAKKLKTGKKPEELEEIPASIEIIPGTNEEKEKKKDENRTSERWIPGPETQPQRDRDLRVNIPVKPRKTKSKKHTVPAAGPVTPMYNNPENYAGYHFIEIKKDEIEEPAPAERKKKQKKKKKDVVDLSSEFFESKNNDRVKKLQQMKSAAEVGVNVDRSDPLEISQGLARAITENAVNRARQEWPGLQKAHMSEPASIPETPTPSWAQLQQQHQFQQQQQQQQQHEESSDPEIVKESLWSFFMSVFDTSGPAIKYDDPILGNQLAMLDASAVDLIISYGGLTEFLLNSPYFRLHQNFLYCSQSNSVREIEQLVSQTRPTLADEYQLAHQQLISNQSARALAPYRSDSDSDTDESDDDSVISDTPPTKQTIKLPNATTIPQLQKLDSFSEDSSDDDDSDVYSTEDELESDDSAESAPSRSRSIGLSTSSSAKSKIEMVGKPTVPENWNITTSSEDSRYTKLSVKSKGTLNVECPPFVPVGAGLDDCDIGRGKVDKTARLKSPKALSADEVSGSDVPSSYSISLPSMHAPFYDQTVPVNSELVPKESLNAIAPVFTPSRQSELKRPAHVYGFSKTQSNVYDSPDDCDNGDVMMDEINAMGGFNEGDEHEDTVIYSPRRLTNDNVEADSSQEDVGGSCVSSVEGGEIQPSQQIEDGAHAAGHGDGRHNLVCSQCKKARPSNLDYLSKIEEVNDSKSLLDICFSQTLSLSHDLGTRDKTKLCALILRKYAEKAVADGIEDPDLTAAILEFERNLYSKLISSTGTDTDDLEAEEKEDVRQLRHLCAEFTEECDRLKRELDDSRVDCQFKEGEIVKLNEINRQLLDKVDDQNQSFRRLEDEKGTLDEAINILKATTVDKELVIAKDNRITELSTAVEENKRLLREREVDMVTLDYEHKIRSLITQHEQVSKTVIRLKELSEFALNRSDHQNNDFTSFLLKEVLLYEKFKRELENCKTIYERAVENTKQKLASGEGTLADMPMPDPSVPLNTHSIVLTPNLQPFVLHFIRFNIEVSVDPNQPIISTPQSNAPTIPYPQPPTAAFPYQPPMHSQFSQPMVHPYQMANQQQQQFAQRMRYQQPGLPPGLGGPRPIIRPIVNGYPGVQAPPMHPQPPLIAPGFFAPPGSARSSSPLSQSSNQSSLMKEQETGVLNERTEEWTDGAGPPGFKTPPKSGQETKQQTKFGLDGFEDSGEGAAAQSRKANESLPKNLYGLDNFDSSDLEQTNSQTSKQKAKVEPKKPEPKPAPVKQKGQATVPRPVAEGVKVSGGEIPVKPNVAPASNYDKLINSLSERFPAYSVERIKQELKKLHDLRGSFKNMTIPDISNEVGKQIEASDKRHHESPKHSKFGLDGYTEQKTPWAGKKQPTAPEDYEGSKDDDCLICLDKLSLYGHDSVRTLECGHHYHKNCINNWFEREKTCPKCRKYALTSEDYPTLR